MTALSHGFSASCQFAGGRHAQKTAHELSGCRECHSSVEHVMHFFASVPMGAMRRKWLTCVCDDDCSAHCSLLEAYKMTNHPFGILYEQRVVMAESMKQDKGYGTIAVSGGESDD